MKQIASVALALALAMGLLHSAQAQINGPTPTLMGQPSFHLYSVPGIVGGAGLATFFGCTNTTSANIRVGVEIFGTAGGAPGNDPSATSLDIAPGGTRTFGTSGAVAISIDSNLGLSPFRGSARILATQRSGITCSAFLADVGSAPPTSMADLKVVKKTRQMGD